MLLKLIDKKDIGRLIGAVIEDGKVFRGPVQNGRNVAFAKLMPQDGILLEYGNSLEPPKHQLLPRSEDLYGYEGPIPSDTAAEEAGSVIFGVRPCDAFAIRNMDKVFLDEKNADPYYAARRERTVILSLVCDEPRETCFCTSVNCSPAGKDGADALVYRIADQLLFEACSKKGEEFILRYSPVFMDSDASSLAKRDAVIMNLSQGNPSVKQGNLAVRQGNPAGSTAGNNSGIKEIVDALTDKEWDEISKKCIGCGVCTFLCPTCHCFGIHHEERGDLKRVVRSQDSCQFEQFTLEASAHNPRKVRTDRVKQRLLHKFSYSVERYGEYFCVGCGRCVVSCPVNLDIREIIMQEGHIHE